MAAAAILNLLLYCHLPLLVTWPISCSSWLNCCKMSLIYLKRQLSYSVCAKIQKHAFWVLIGRDRSYGVIWTWREEYKKKERTKSKQKFAIFAYPLPVVPHRPNFVCRVVSRISFFFEFQKDRLKMWEQWGVEFLVFPLTWHIAYTTACCYRTSREFIGSSCRALEQCNIEDRPTDQRPTSVPGRAFLEELQTAISP